MQNSQLINPTESNRRFQSYTEESSSKVDWQKREALLRTIPCQLEEFTDKYIYTFDLPNASADSIEVDVTSGFLTVVADRQYFPLAEEKLQYDGVIPLRNKTSLQVERSIVLAEDIDEGSIEAFYNEKVLKVHVNKQKKTSSNDRSFTLRDQLGDMLLKWFEVNQAAK